MQYNHYIRKNLLFSRVMCAKKTVVIWVDGGKRVGKTTLINTLLDHFKEAWHSVLVMKGAWSRSWTWSTDHFYDPKDEWRKEMKQILYTNPIIDSLHQRETATGRLQTELSTILEDNSPPHIIILDRTIITSHALNSLTDHHRPFSATAAYYKQQYNIDLIIPDILLALYATDTNILLSRIEVDEQQEINESAVQENELFTQTILTLSSTDQNPLGSCNIHALDTTAKNKDEVYQEALQVLNLFDLQPNDTLTYK